MQSDHAELGTSCLRLALNAECALLRLPLSSAVTTLMQAACKLPPPPCSVAEFLHRVCSAGVRRGPRDIGKMLLAAALRSKGCGSQEAVGAALGKLMGGAVWVVFGMLF